MAYLDIYVLYMNSSFKRNDRNCEMNTTMNCPSQKFRLMGIIICLYANFDIH